MSNFLINNLITKINLGAKRKLRFIKIDLNKLNLNIIKILYNNGTIRTYLIKNNNIIIYFKFYLRKMITNLTLESKPSNKKYVTLIKLSNIFNKNNFSGFYIISSSKGLISSTSCLIKEHIAGEIILKINI